MNMTMAEIIELRRSRAGLIATAREVLEAAEGEQRDLSAEEREKYDRILADAVALENRAQRAEELLALENGMDQRAGQPPNRPEPENGTGGGNQRGRAATEYAEAFRGYLRTGQPMETRGLQVDDDSRGGYLVPDQFIRDLIKALDESVFMRSRGRVIAMPNADSLGVPTLAADPADPIWTAELGTGDEDQTMAFGKRALHPHPLAKRLKVSRKLLRAAPDVDALVRERLTYKFATTMENAFLNGSGSGEPLGVFTASDDGVPTSRDAATGSTTGFVFANLVLAKMQLKQGYWARAVWLMHPDALPLLVNLKDSDNQYVWQANARDASPETLLGLPLHYSSFAPHTYTSGLYAGILADFSHYWIVDSLGMNLQRLDELYSESNQVGFIGRLESDGAPVLPEAFVRLKCAAS